MIRGLGSIFQPVTRQFWIVLLLGFGLCWLAFQVWYFRVGAGHQHLNLERARSELPRAEALLQADPRFAEVQVRVFTGSNGSLGFFGKVEKSNDLNTLLRLVAEERFSVPIFWRVLVAKEGHAD